MRRLDNSVQSAKSQQGARQQTTGLENRCAQLFRQLTYAWYADAASDRVEVLAAELAAASAMQPESVCLGLMRPEAIPRLFGLVFFLDGYGLTLRQRYRTTKDGVYIFLDRRGVTKSDFSGVTIRARNGLAQAA
jgi:hypothetical protein